jgi:putative ABC transport system ATP-binding protein
MSSTVARRPSVLAGRSHVAALHAVTVVQPRPNGQQILLEDVSTTFRPGELTAVLSRYDAAARAVLDVLSGHRSPAWGAVVVAGTEINRLDHRAMLAVRDAHVARVWPGFALHPKLTVRANLAVALRQSGRRADEATSVRIATIGDLLDLHGKLGFQDGPGDARRVLFSFARALAGGAELVLADDPTGRLARPAEQAVLGAVARVARALDVAVVLATRDPVTASAADRIAVLERARLLGDTAAA